jgi:anti-sigma B factor antagonist
VPVLATQVRTSRITGDRYAVTVAGELDADVAPIFRARLADLVEGGATTIVLDLLEVPDVDAVGLAVIVDLGRVLKASRGQLVVVVDDPYLIKLLTLAGTGRWFRIETSLFEAVDHVVDAIA